MRKIKNYTRRIRKINKKRYTGQWSHIKTFIKLKFVRMDTSQDISWKPASRWRFKVHHHLRPPPRGGYLQGGKAAQSSMIPSHMFTEHQRPETRARRTRCWWKICRLLESRKHESAKGAPSAPAAPKTAHTSANRAWILGIWRQTTLRLILSPVSNSGASQFLND